MLVAFTQLNDFPGPWLGTRAEVEKTKSQNVQDIGLFSFEFDDISLGERCAVSKEVYVDYCTVSNDVDS